jgi:hypothetical protein
LANIPINPFSNDSLPDIPRDGGAERYTRSHFMGSGRDGFTDRTAQDQLMWEELQNTNPITSGSVRRRRGAKFINNLTDAAYYGRSAIYQSDVTGQRTLLFSSSTKIKAVNEDGTIYSNNVFTPTTVDPNNPPRPITSRSYAYFSDGNDMDFKKWDGSASGGTSNWGISVDDGTGLIAGLKPTTSGSNVTSGWTNPGAITTNDGLFATYALGAHVGATNALRATGFGYAVPGGATINGIMVEVKGKSDVNAANLNIQLEKAGVPYGASVSYQLGTSNIFQSVGGSGTYLWGGSWTPADVNNASFGVRLVGFTGNPAITNNFFLDFVQVTVFYTAAFSQISVGGGGAGAVNLTIGRIYYCSFQNSVTGHLSDLNVASTSTGPLVNKQVPLSTIPVSMDPQVDTKVILASADGGDPSILYWVTELPNAATTYTDNTDEITLVLNQQYLFTDDFGNEFGVTENIPPPTTGDYCAKHKSRLWMAAGQNLFFSKSTAELTLPNGFIAGKYEECWPGDNFFDISEGAEQIRGLLSDGNVLYVGTESHIRAIYGDDPSNFQEPEIIHPHVGIINQQTWQIVYAHGSPAGMMWLTPDYKVMASDGQVYYDVGHPVQDILNSITAERSCAMYCGDGDLDLYMLAVATSGAQVDTLLVYDLRAKMWHVWKVQSISTLLYNQASTGAQQWWFVADVPDQTSMYQFDAMTTLDEFQTAIFPIPIPFLARTPWMHFEQPTWRKVLDELEVIGDPGLTVSLSGASTQFDFENPVVLLTDRALVDSPFGNKKIYMATLPAKYRYYQLTFKSSTSVSNVLESFSLRYVPYNSL